MLVVAFLALQIIVEAPTIINRDSSEAFLIVKRVDERLCFEKVVLNSSHQMRVLQLSVDQSSDLEIVLTFADTRVDERFVKE